MAFAGISYLAILVAAVASWLAGAAWYGALGQAWLGALGKTKEELMGPSGRPSPVPFVVSFLAELVMAWMLAGIMGHLGPGQVTLANGIISGFFLWLGFVATTILVNHRFSGASLRLTAIDGGHWLVVLLVQGAVIGLFGAG
jgi:hypothetical protein